MRDHHFDLEKMWMKEYKVDDTLYLLLLAVDITPRLQY